MKHCNRVGAGFLMLWLLPGITAALDRDALSPVLREMLPPENHVQVHFHTGEPVIGELLSRDDTRIEIGIQQRGILFTRTYPLEDIDRIADPDHGAIMAERLLEMELDPRRSLPVEDASESVSLLEEYLALFPDHSRADAVRTRRDAFAEEIAKLEQGLEKVDGEWLGPIQLGIARYKRADDLLEELRRQHSGIERPQFRGSREARQRYERLEEFQREIARGLPHAMTSRLPTLLEANAFDPAAEEAGALLQFWLQHVLRPERQDRRTDTDAFRGIDFRRLIRMQTQILEAWHPHAPDVPADVDAPDTPDTMVLVPEGYFLQGDPEAEPEDDAFPARVVWVDAFFIDRTEVTNAEYRAFYTYVQETADASMAHPDAPPLKDHTPRGWDYPELSGDDQPVVGVDWFDAYAYARWVGKRLPTEAEWEKAARGTTLYPYPWGEEDPSTRFVNSPSGRNALRAELARMTADDFRPPPLPAATWPAGKEIPSIASDISPRLSERHARSPYGILHMAGNAAEWTADYYGRHYYRTAPLRNPPGPRRGTHRVFRGGSYRDDDAALTVTRRMHLGRTSRPGHRRGPGTDVDERPLIGFRCAQSLPDSVLH